MDTCQFHLSLPNYLPSYVVNAIFASLSWRDSWFWLSSNKELENVLSDPSCFGLKKAPHISELYSNTGRTKVSNSFLTVLIWAPVWTFITLR